MILIEEPDSHRVLVMGVCEHNSERSISIRPCPPRPRPPSLPLLSPSQEIEQAALPNVRAYPKGDEFQWLHFFLVHNRYAITSTPGRFERGWRPRGCITKEPKEALET